MGTEYRVVEVVIIDQIRLDGEHQYALVLDAQTIRGFF